MEAPRRLLDSLVFCGLVPAMVLASASALTARSAHGLQEWTDRSPHQVRFVGVAPDVRLEVLDWGGDGLSLVFLAGANFNAHAFDDFAPRFTDTHRVLGITRRGHGASSWPDSGYDLPTLVEDIRLVLDSLGIDRAILAGHSMAGSEMTLLATESPDRVAGLTYIDAGHDPTDIDSLRVPELCSFSGLAEAMERTFENPELVRRTQWHTGEDGVRRPFASAAAGIDLPTPDYSGVVAPALGIYYVPERTEDLFMGVVDPSPACVAAFHRYIHGGIAAFADGVEQATVIALSDTNHNIHLATPDTLEAVMRRWLADLPEEQLRAALQPVAVAPSDTVHVGPPTGEKNSDRASVQAAFDAVRPGGTVQFAPGTYLLGAGVRLTVPGVTALGHSDGTVLRGCDPEAFTPDATAMVQIVFGCTGLYIQAERQTIRGLTFEYIWHAIVVGPYPATVEEAAALGGKLVPAYPAGGQVIEGNTFRATINGLRVLGTGNELSVVRNNDFIDVFHAIGIYGAPLHFLGNRVTVTDSERVPFSRHPGSAIIVSPMQTECAGHVVAGNRIEGYPDPIYVLAARGETCRGVEIRDNTIHAARVKVLQTGGFYKPTETDSTMVGAPITLMNRKEPTPWLDKGDTEGVLEDILVEGNHIVGAEGLGIIVQNVSRSRIAANTITGVQRRAPYPGLTWDGFEQGWEAANGSAIWISAGSDENEIVGNTFQNIAASAVVIEGNRNHVELADPADVVRDLGTGNRVSGHDTLPSHAYESRFFDAGGARLHYLDFGGAGLPILFTAGSRSAETWAGFAPRFTDRHRVLAITDRGVLPSEGEESGFARRAGDILALLDTLGIERAVLVANSNPAQILIYLAEHHAERLAGLVFLAPDTEAGLESVEDPSRAMLMVERALLSAQDRDPDEAGNWDEEDLYRPRYLAADTATIAVPALTFVNMEGTRGLERSYYPLEVAELVASGALAIKDSTARTYFERLAADEAMQAEVRAAWDGTFVPVFRANEQAFFHAFGDRLRAVRLDVPPMNGVPVVTGYEYLTAPELIEAHVRSFLEEVARSEALESVARPGLSSHAAPDATTGSKAPGRAGPGRGSAIPCSKDFHWR